MGGEEEKGGGENCCDLREGRTALLYLLLPRLTWSENLSIPRLRGKGKKKKKRKREGGEDR